MKLLISFMIFFTGFAVGGLIGFELGNPVGNEIRVNYQTVSFPDGRTLYLSARVWGLAGGHEEVRVCNQPIEFGLSLDRQNCLIFHTREIFYRKEGVNRLSVLATNSSFAEDGPQKV